MAKSLERKSWHTNLHGFFPNHYIRDWILQQRWKWVCRSNCHKQRSTLWLGTCPNPPYKLSHKLKEKSNLINMLMIIVCFLSHYGKFIMACHHSKCLLWVPNDCSSYSYVCVWRWTLYALWESTISSEWFCYTNLIRGWDINSVFCFFIEALLEPLTYLEEYNCHEFRLNYILGCDNQVYHSIVSTLSMYY